MKWRPGPPIPPIEETHLREELMTRWLDGCLSASEDLWEMEREQLLYGSREDQESEW